MKLNQNASGEIEPDFASKKQTTNPFLNQASLPGSQALIPQRRDSRNLLSQKMNTAVKNKGFDDSIMLNEQEKMNMTTVKTNFVNDDLNIGDCHQSMTKTATLAANPYQSNSYFDAQKRQPKNFKLKFKAPPEKAVPEKSHINFDSSNMSSRTFREEDQQSIRN